MPQPHDNDSKHGSFQHIADKWKFQARTYRAACAHLRPDVGSVKRLIQMSATLEDCAAVIEEHLAEMAEETEALRESLEAVDVRR